MKITLRVVSNFGDSREIDARAKLGSREESSLVTRLLVGVHFRAHVYFAGIAKIRDYSQSKRRSLPAVHFSAAVHDLFHITDLGNALAPV